MEIIKFTFFGFQLQEPMAMLTNGLLSLFCAFAYVQLKNNQDKANYWWMRFYLFFGISTFCAVWGHALFYYFDIPGKFPCWFFGTLANICAANGMLSFDGFAYPKKFARRIIYAKSIFLFLLAIYFRSFIFITIDAAITYVVYTGVFASFLKKRGLYEMKYIISGVVVLLPSIFIFLLKINPHRWLNKDDVSHILMLGCIFLFYLGMSQWANRWNESVENV